MFSSSFSFHCVLELPAKLEPVTSWLSPGSPVRLPAGPLRHARGPFALAARGGSFSAKHAPNSLPHTYLGASIRAVRTIDADLSVRPGSYRDSSAWVSPRDFPCFSEAVSDPADLDPASTGGCHGSASPHRSTVRPELPGCLKPASSCRW